MLCCFVCDGIDNCFMVFGVDVMFSLLLQQVVVQFYQVSGVLFFVGLVVGVIVLCVVEVVVVWLVEWLFEVDQVIVDIIECVDFVLMVYIVCLLVGNRMLLLVFYFSYCDLQQFNGVECIYLVDFWYYDWSWCSILLEDGVLLCLFDSVCVFFEVVLLCQMCQFSFGYVVNLFGLCVGFVVVLLVGMLCMLWQFVVVVFEGQVLKLIGSDVYIKCLGFKLLYELCVLGQGEVFDCFVQDLLFFCVQCCVF